MCPNSGGSYSHKRAKYFGAYWWRNVNYISEIKAVCVMHKDKCVIKWNNTKLDDAEIIQEAKDKIKDFKDWNKSDVENSEMQLFLFDKLIGLEYKKSTKGGMFSSKRYFNTKAKNINELIFKIRTAYYDDKRKKENRKTLLSLYESQLKTFIEDGYNKYFDGDGNLRQ